MDSNKVDENALHKAGPSDDEPNMEDIGDEEAALNTKAPIALNEPIRTLLKEELPSDKLGSNTNPINEGFITMP